MAEALSLWKVVPFLDPADRVLKEAADRWVIQALSPGKVLLVPGTVCQAVPLVLSGSIRVYMMAETGREITLYRIEEGQSCILSSSCLLSEGSFPAFARVEEETQALLVPSVAFQDLITRSSSWRKWVFSQFSGRLASVIGLVEEVAFHHMDQRLAGLLVDQERAAHVSMTHQEMASQLGTTREVVTRILREFEGEGLVQTRRGGLEVLDSVVLRKMSSTSEGTG